MKLAGPLPVSDILGEWHQWFAWHPVDLLDGSTAWLEIVERRQSYKVWNLDIYGQWITEYRQVGSDHKSSRFDT